MMRDPDRLSDDTEGADLSRALRLAQGDVLSPDAKERVRAGLLAAGIGVASSGARAAANRAASPAAKLFAAAGMKVGLAALGLVALVCAAILVRARVNARHDTPVTLASAPHAPVEAEPAVAPNPEATAAPSEATTAPSEATTAPSEAATAPSAVASAPRAVPSKPRSPREGSLLLQARRMLETDPARALELVRTHEREFPKSQLAPERARIAAEAQQRLEK